ncbi:ATP-binding protein [Halioxenophilus sp. WMMB6]|uniref:hybrid sensor histidine kinase/response regulator n=1 Tax=Halioxenophilus sp. WMMB6 TaxID=3073815 RepID=UPI00295E603A|nr:ATP-binding protein [Halioxenophilus sp. WMMB6]
MRAPQQIFRVRRQYNQWVGNQTLEDYSLRFTATGARRFSIEQVAKTALGATAFLALEAIAAAVTLNWGFTNAFWAMITVGLVIFITGAPISYYAAKNGLDIDLLTRSAGFGYLGSTITSLIYASFTFIFFALEAAILAAALHALLGIPPAVGYILCAIAVVPIVTHGISAISRFQIGTQPVWLVLQLSALAVVAVYEFSKIGDWLHYAPAHQANSGGFDLALFGGASAVLFALIAQIGEQVDYLRFMPEKNSSNRRRWWFWMLLAGPGWIFIGLIKMLFGSFLAVLAIERGASFEQATDPTYMYQAVFNYITHSPTFSLILAGVMVVISQMKINVTNAYAGSIAWSNFFSRLTHSHPGRVVWLVFNVLIALMLMELGIYRALESILGIFAIVALSWLSTLSADLMINKPLKLSPPQAEFKRAHLYDVNPVGVGSMILATTLGILAYLGVFGSVAKHLAPYLSLLVCFIATPAIALFTRGRYYLARQSPELHEHSGDSLRCCICETQFEHSDISYCPAYQGAICSLCCSLDARCLDSCKPHGRLSVQTRQFFELFLPPRMAATINSRVGRFVAIFLCVNMLTGALLSLIYYHMHPTDAAQQQLLGTTIWTLFFVLMIVFGVISWLFLLAHESQEVAQKESNRQTQRLVEEIEAHQITDQSLQQAKELAERASSAKSRYLTGISHELRTPLQSILGYAQLLQQNNPNNDQQKGLRIIRRSGEYLADLLEGLLDISKIEAGRLDLYRNQVKLPELLDQVVEMFAPQAEAKGIEFRFNRPANLPAHVITDEKRLRQILINLLSNAIKYTVEGEVEFIIRYRNQVAEFIVKDTGVGIAQEDIQRILDPFERVRNTQVPNVTGTGLGLTIVRLLTDVMGGELQITSTVGTGSEFKVSLMLSRVDTPVMPVVPPQSVIGYEGDKLVVLVVDDDPVHRGLISDLLVPLGFITLEAKDAPSCMEILQEREPDLFLLDVTMPGMNGLELAEWLRAHEHHSPIIMISADAQERHRQPADNCAHDDYMVKPINNQVLLEKISKLLEIRWLYQGREKITNHQAKPEHTQPAAPLTTESHALLRELKAYADLGYYRGVNETLEKIATVGSLTSQQYQKLQTLAAEFRYELLSQAITGEISHEC